MLRRKIQRYRAKEQQIFLPEICPAVVIYFPLLFCPIWSKLCTRLPCPPIYSPFHSFIHSSKIFAWKISQLSGISTTATTTPTLLLQLAGQTKEDEQPCSTIIYHRHTNPSYWSLLTFSNSLANANTSKQQQHLCVWPRKGNNGLPIQQTEKGNKCVTAELYAKWVFLTHYIKAHH